MPLFPPAPSRRAAVGRAESETMWSALKRKLGLVGFVTATVLVLMGWWFFLGSLTWHALGYFLA
jgi:hypothetical protein